MKMNETWSNSLELWQQPANQPTNQPTHQPNPTQPNPTQPNPIQPNQPNHLVCLPDEIATFPSGSAHGGGALPSPLGDGQEVWLVEKTKHE